MTFLFLPEAEAEFLEAIEYLEEQQKGLGLDLSREVFDTIGRIIRHPKAWPPYKHRSRRCLTNRFPYAVIYRIEEDFILIFAVAHMSREPDYWSKRVN